VPLSAQYPLVEAFTAGLAVAAVAVFGATLDAAIAFAFLAALVALSGIDLRIRELPDGITLSGLIVALAVSPWSGLVDGPAEALVGALAGAGSLYLLAEFWGYVRNMDPGDVMGGGDLKLLAMIGAVLGWPALLPTVFLASVAGAAVGLSQMVAAGRRDLRLTIPFGPFLAVGAAVALFFPDWLPALLARLAG
jgi:leader peptidase (prepilin peptidase)/N-methyltransferase